MRDRNLQDDMSVLQDLADELMILHAAWVIAGDDDRRRKPLSVGPATAKRWRQKLNRVERLVRKYPEIFRTLRRQRSPNQEER